MEVEKHSEKICDICGSSETSEYDYGEWKTIGGYTVHNFCVLLSGGCLRLDDANNNDFSELAVRYMIGAHTKLVCVYCQKGGASLFCAFGNCRKRFHVVCGIQNKCLSQFGEPFESFCHRHVHIEEKYDLHEDFKDCQICNEAMGDYDPITSIPSCCGYGYYHKKCMQKNAITAGYFTHCPSCGEDPDGYRTFLRSRGIFCPDKDADWITDVNKCYAIECLCSNGRDFVEDQGVWKICRCRYCGKVAVHAKCRTDASTGPLSCQNCIEKHSISTPLHFESTKNNSPGSKENDSLKMKSRNFRKREYSFDETAKWFRKKKFLSESLQCCLMWQGEWQLICHAPPELEICSALFRNRLLRQTKVQIILHAPPEPRTRSELFQSVFLIG